MNTRKINGQAFDSLKNGLLDFLHDKSYGSYTLSNYRQKLNQLAEYMLNSGINSYKPLVGQQFIDDYLHTHVLSKSGGQFLRTVVRRLDDFIAGDYRLQLKAEPTPLSQCHNASLESYIQKCNGDGNRESTIIGKTAFLREFLSNLSTLGCLDIKNANAATIGKACLMQRNKDAWAVIRQLLRHLKDSKAIDSDFAAIVPHYKKPFRLPTTYSEAEIKRFEEAIDTTKKIGKRDYAMLLLATRLGMRSGDIVNLTFSALDFENNIINVFQEKTNEPLRLPMLPVVKAALTDYLENGRAKSELPYIFLQATAPFEKVSTSILRHETSKYFEWADIDTAGKKHGPHTFRSSLSSSMINNEISYDVVRKILGHTDPDAVKHYAKVDIERLREYAIEPPAPTGCFTAFLGGRQS